ncbi:MAG: hypothetical protein HN509_01285 [Halobacteriovoraceae bacterium]|nr:hypothetical protein [Halobacteriovoraceae bacterium]MBT5093845.1 hypothetical protein [Halobacteriovoraceae bacterium]
MKLVFLILCLSFFSAQSYSGEFEQLEARIYGQSAKNKSLEVNQQFPELHQLALELAEYALPFHRQVLADIKKGKPLHGQQLTILHKLVSCYMVLGYQLEKVAEGGSAQNISILANLDRIYTFDNAYAPFYANKKFRRLVNAADKSYDVAKKELKRHIKRLISKASLKKINKQIKKFLSNSNPLLVERVQDHPAFESVKDKKKFRKLRKKMAGQGFSDFWGRVTQFAVHHLSGAFGNGAGAVRWRKGHLYKDPVILKEILGQLRPLDVITEKTRFALTDTFIPGHFGHNAIWLGTKAQLLEIGMWDHPSIVPIQKDIEAGRSIIETDRSGTHLKSMKDFMNVDEFGLLRLKNGDFTERRMRSIYKVAIAQLGKTYDFNFDVETTDKLVCSELLYQAFGDINWPTEDYIGRTTISPDNVVSLSLYNGTPLELVYFIRGTKEGITHKSLDAMAADIGFVKKDGEFFRPEKVCVKEKVRRIGPRRRSTRSGSNSITVNKCHTEYIPLNYQGHDRIRDFNH